MLKLVALALLVAAAIAVPQCGCDDSISALEKRVAFLEARLEGVVGNSEYYVFFRFPHFVCLHCLLSVLVILLTMFLTL